MTILTVSRWNPWSSRWGHEVAITAGVRGEGYCSELASGQSAEFEFDPEAPFFVRALSLYPHELGRVDVKVSFHRSTIRWSTIYQVGEVVLNTVWRPGDDVRFSLRNVSMESVLARVMLRGRWL